MMMLSHFLDLYGAYIVNCGRGWSPGRDVRLPLAEVLRARVFPQRRDADLDRWRQHARDLPGAGGQSSSKARRATLGSAQLVTPAMAPDGGTWAERPPRRERSQRPRLVRYSSGTTGIKKGVAVSHRALLWQIDAYAEAIGAGPADRIVSWLPLYHDMGLIACLFLPLLKRIPLVAMSPFHGAALPRCGRMRGEAAGTLSWLPNFAYSFLAGTSAARRLRAGLSSSRRVVNCSEPIMASSHRAFLERFGDRGASAAQLGGQLRHGENTFAVTSGGFGRPPATESVDSERFDREHRASRCRKQRRGRVLVSSGAHCPSTSWRSSARRAGPGGARGRRDHVALALSHERL